MRGILARLSAFAQILEGDLCGFGLTHPNEGAEFFGGESFHICLLLIAESAPGGKSGGSALVGAVFHFLAHWVFDDQPSRSVRFVGDGSGAAILFVVGFHIADSFQVVGGLPRPVWLDAVLDRLRGVPEETEGILDVGAGVACLLQLGDVLTEDAVQPMGEDEGPDGLLGFFVSFHVAFSFLYVRGSPEGVRRGLTNYLICVIFILLIIELLGWGFGSAGLFFCGSLWISMFSKVNFIFMGLPPTPS
jgi:hypothetical protein